MAQKKTSDISTCQNLEYLEILNSEPHNGGCSDLHTGRCVPGPKPASMCVYWMNICENQPSRPSGVKVAEEKKLVTFRNGVLT